MAYTASDTRIYYQMYVQHHLKHQMLAQKTSINIAEWRGFN